MAPLESGHLGHLALPEEAEIKRLRDALRACVGQLGVAHQAMEGPNARWVEFGDGDGYYDDDLVCTPVCTVCIAQAKAATALGEPAATTGIESRDA